MTENAIQFLPFHAINEFMRPDFRLNVVRYTLTRLDELPEQYRNPIQAAIRKTVKVPGFRNSEKAPALVKVLPTAKAFEKNSELVAAILAGWAELHPDLKSQVYAVLQRRGWRMFPPEFHALEDLPSLKSEADWGVLPLHADRARLPGFLIYWHAGQDFEAIYATFTELFPDASASIDEVSLMAVWLANRLPYHIVGAESEAEEPS